MMKAILLSILLLSLLPGTTFAAHKQIDPSQSTLTIHVGKTGLFSVGGHEHIVSAPIADGVIDDGASARVTFRVESARITVLPEDHQNEVQHTMQERVLESARFPEISFSSDQVRPAGDSQWEVSGHLTLHGETRPLHMHVKYIEGKYVGTATIKQKDFGIQPVSAGGGTVKVKDELTIDFSIKTK
jgi:polyisoprenoid-binding protein YceI